MLSSIHPLGERARGNRWGVTAGWYLAGALVGGSALGAISGGLGALLLPEISSVTAAAIAAAVAALAAIADLLHWPVPSPERQVNESWLTRYRPWVYASGFGFQLGTGVMTFVKTATIPALWLLAVLAANPATGAVIGACFGLLRGAAILTVAGVRDPNRLRDYFRRMAGLQGAARIAAIVAAVGAAIFATASGVMA